MKIFFLKSYLLILILLVWIIELQAQYVVSGTLQSIPSKTTPTEAKVTFTNTSNGNKYAQRTRDGTYSLSIPSGTFEERVELLGHYIIIDTLNINGNNVINEKLMKDTSLTSQIYLDANKNLLFLFKRLTGTDDLAPSKFLVRSRDSPLRIDARNYNPSDPLSMPQGIRPYLDTILADYSSKTGGLLVFTEENVGPVRVQFQYPPTAQMPQPVFGWTEFGYDLTNIWIDREYLIYYMNNAQHDRNNAVFARELYRTTDMRTNSADPNMVSYYGISAPRLHPDEAEVIKRVFTLDNGTNMKKYRDVVVQSISNVLPQIITFSAPVNNSTVTYVDGNLVVNYNSINPRDGDGEAQRVVIRLSGNGLDQYITDANTDGIILVDKSLFQPEKQYTLEGMSISGFDTIPAANVITFNTPEDIPTSLYNLNEKPISFYPNPVKTNITIENLPIEYGNLTIEVFDNHGKILQQTIIKDNIQDKLIIDFSGYTPATYYITIWTESFSKTLKIIKQ